MGWYRWAERRKERRTVEFEENWTSSQFISQDSLTYSTLTTSPAHPSSTLSTSKSSIQDLAVLNFSKSRFAPPLLTRRTHEKEIGMAGVGSYSSNRSQFTSPISTLSSLSSHRIGGLHQSYNLKLLKEMERQVTFSKFHSPLVLSLFPFSQLSSTHIQLPIDR